MNLINFTIMLTLTAAGILLVKKLLGTKITPRGQMLFWLLICVQILAWPISEWMPEAEWALRQYVPQVTEVKQEEVFGDHGVKGLLIGDEGQFYDVERTTVQMTIPVTGRVVETESMRFLGNARWRKSILQNLWAAGAAVFLLAAGLGAWKQYRKLKVLPECSDAAVIRAFGDIKKTMELDQPVGLKTGSEATMLAGLWRPSVYLAADSCFDEAELRHVFAHELTHYKHRDLWLNVISAGVLCAFWWNPVIWLAFRRFHLDMEVYCDYDAAKVTGDRRAYAQTLVKAAAGKKRFVIATTSLVNEESQVSRRVKTLVKFKKPKVWVSVLAVCVLLGVSVGLAVNPAGNPIITEEIKEGQLVNGDKLAMLSPEELNELVKAVNRAEMQAYLPHEKNDVGYQKLLETVRGPQQGTIRLVQKEHQWKVYELEFLRYMAEDIYITMHLEEAKENTTHWIACDERLTELVTEIWMKRFPETDVTIMPEPEELGIYDEFQKQFLFEGADGFPGELELKESWVYGDTVYVNKNDEFNYLNDELLKMLLYSEEAARTELTTQQVSRRMTGLWWNFDYWQEWHVPVNPYNLLIGHDRGDPDGEGDVYVIQFGEGMRGWRVDLPEAAYLLADSVKLKFGLESEGHDWRVCDGDKSWEEAMAIFEAEYGQTYSEEELAFLQARNEGTYLEATQPKAEVLEIQEVSALENAVRFYWVKEKTYFNDVSGRSSIWAGGGFEHTENPDGSLTMRRSYINHLFNDGEGWYHVNNGFDANTQMHLNEDGSLKAGLIRY